MLQAEGQVWWKLASKQSRVLQFQKGTKFSERCKGTLIVVSGDGWQDGRQNTEVCLIAILNTQAD